MGRFKEEPADIQVKARLWEATAREAMHFAAREADEFVKGIAYPPGQKSVTAAAKKRGYPCGLIRTLGRASRLSLTDEVTAALAAYRVKLGLDV